MKKLVATVFGLLVVVGVLGGIKGAQIGALIASAEDAGPPPETVTAAPATTDTWTSSLDAVGTAVAVRGVDVTSEVPGMVRRIAFRSGQDVRAGQLLVQLDTAVESAELASADAEAHLAKTTLKRVRGLRRDDVNSPAELDQAEAAAMQAAARVRALKATIAKKSIRAPFSGRVGIREIDPGQYLSVGTRIVTLQAFDELYVDFSLPQRELSKLDVGREVSVRTDAFGPRLWEGAIETIDPNIDEATRNIRVRARVENDDLRLRPGMFVEVQVRLSDQRDVVVVPVTAIVYASYGDSIYILEKPSKDEVGEESSGTEIARQVFVRLGERRGDLVEVREGVTPGQRVVTTGGFKLRNGASVVVDNELSPEPEIDPDPEDS